MRRKAHIEGSGKRGKEEKLRGKAEFNIQEMKGPHCGPRFS